MLIQLRKVMIRIATYAAPALFVVAGVLGLLAAVGIVGFVGGMLAMLGVIVGIWLLPSVRTLRRNERTKTG